MKRTPLPEPVVARVRRERLRPRPTQWDYLHLRGLKRALADAFASEAVAAGPVLDLYCGTQPYREMIPWAPVVGFDVDRHFARADVVGSLPLPFRDGAFSAIVCSQALYLVDDPTATVAEMRRVLAPGGLAVVTVPHVFRREIPAERRYSARTLAALFAAWHDVRARGAGGVGAGLVYFPGSLAGAAARRWRLARWLLPAAALPLNAAGAVLDAALRPLERRWPASLILVARRPGS